jgi:putative redox protein
MATATARISDAHYATAITTGRHALTADEPERNGGADVGPAPFDLLLSALGACTAMTLKMYAEHKHLAAGSPWKCACTITAARPRPGSSACWFRPARWTRRSARGSADVAERTPVTLAIKGGVPIQTSLG